MLRCLIPGFKSPGQQQPKTRTHRELHFRGSGSDVCCIWEFISVLKMVLGCSTVFVFAASGLVGFWFSALVFVAFVSCLCVCVFCFVLVIASLGM